MLLAALDFAALSLVVGTVARRACTQRSTQPAACAARAVPVIIGLTGSIGMGKSTATHWLRKCGILVHDADACVHALYGPGGAAVEAIGAEFPGVTSAEAGVDRAKLSQAVAAAGREAALKTLEGIVHPLVTADREAFIAKAAANDAWCVVLDIPLLLETMDAEARARQLDALVVVSAPVRESKNELATLVSRWLSLLTAIAPRGLC